MNCSKTKGRIHSIESFGTVDGPGVRFVVFMQGCPLRCLYCHNPDTWDFAGGTEMTTDEILEKYESVKSFITGGLTVTGGEPLGQMEFVLELFKKAKEKGIHTCIDTSGAYFNEERKNDFSALLKVTDLVMLDIKHIKNPEHKSLTGMENENIKAFAHFVADNNVEIWIRHVVVPGITDKKEDLYELGKFIAHLKTLKALDVLPYHDMGKAKYKALGIDYPLKDTPPLEKEKANEAKGIIMQGIKDELKKQA
ncbi:MAG: pyruvate formate-lyase-activating protein [Clostridia bacterium]|nr:pyruvate formate-lyase-activating protein [Clostridia bacterium]